MAVGRSERTGGASVMHDADSFLQFLTAERRLSPNTLAAYRNDLRQFEEYLAVRQHDPLGTRLDQRHQQRHLAPADPTTASREQVAGFFLSLREDKGYSAATIARKMAAVKSLFHYLMRQGAVTTNPTADLGSPEVEEAAPARHLRGRCRPADAADRQEGARPRACATVAMLHLLYATGMRVSELVTLDLGDLDFEKGGGAVRRARPAGAAVSRWTRRRWWRCATTWSAAGPSCCGPARPTSALFLNHRGQRLTRQGFWLIMKAVARESGVTSK